MREDRWWDPLLGLLLTPLTVPLFLLLVIGSIPVGIVATICLEIREVRFRRALREKGRWREWDEIERHLQAGEGTLVIEQAHKMPARIWWAPEKVLDLAPVPPPAEGNLDVFGIFPPHPFVAWCYGRYLEPARGAAVLTEPPFALPPGLFFARFFQERYPAASVVDTVYCRAGGAAPAAAPDSPGDRR